MTEQQDQDIQMYGHLSSWTLKCVNIQMYGQFRCVVKSIKSDQQDQLVRAVGLVSQFSQVSQVRTAESVRAVGSVK